MQRNIWLETGKKRFCKLDCSELTTASQWQNKYASRTFAYRRSGQGFSRALSAFSSFKREYLDQVITADKCDQYFDDIGIAASDADLLIKNLRATFESMREAGSKLTMHKCHFGATEIDFLGRTITPEGVKPQKNESPTSLKKQNSRSLRRSYNVILVSSITTGTIYRDYPKNWFHSSNFTRKTRRF